MQCAAPTAIASIPLAPTEIGVATDKEPPGAIPSCEKSLLPQPNIWPYLTKAIQKPDEPHATCLTPSSGTDALPGPIVTTCTGNALSSVVPSPRLPFVPAPQVQTVLSASTAAIVPPPAAIETIPVR